MAWSFLIYYYTYTVCNPETLLHANCFLRLRLHYEALPKFSPFGDSFASHLQSSCTSTGPVDLESQGSSDSRGARHRFDGLELAMGAFCDSQLKVHVFHASFFLINLPFSFVGNLSSASV